jgi:AcrR family transcriptional regulator
MNTSKQLRPGRHQLSRDEVRSHQRDRIFHAMETVMAVKGYADTSVADIIKVAGVSRQTFYQLFCSKQDCFLASFGQRQGSVLGTIFETPTSKAPLERFAALLRTYLTVMARDPAVSRLYLIGVYTAGREALAKRLEMQQQFVDAVAALFEAQTEQDRFVCQTLVAAVSTLVTNALLDDDPQAVRKLHQPLIPVAGRPMTAD